MHRSPHSARRDGSADGGLRQKEKARIVRLRARTEFFLVTKTLRERGEGGCKSRLFSRR